MPSLVNWFKKITAKSAENNDLFLFATAAIGWILASAAQTLGIITNKKLNKEDKKFLIPQELADGAMNILLYAAVTTPLIALTKRGVKNTNLSPKAKGGAQVIASIAGGVISSNILTPIARNKLASTAGRKQLDESVQKQDPGFYRNYDPLFQKRHNSIPTKMNSFMTFTRNNGIKI